MRNIYNIFSNPDATIDVLAVDGRTNVMIGVLADVIFNLGIVVAAFGVSAIPEAYPVVVTADVVINGLSGVLFAVKIDIVSDTGIDVLNVNVLALVSITLDIAVTSPWEE